MLGLPARLRAADGTALTALCLLLVLSVSGRIQAYRFAALGSEPSEKTAVVDLGEGIRLSRIDGAHHTLPIASCSVPAQVELVEPSPHGRDTLLASPPNPSDHIFYVYRGWILQEPRAAMTLSALYFLRRAGTLVGIGTPFVRDELAVKVVVPVNCDASPKDLMAALRGAARR